MKNKVYDRHQLGRCKLLAVSMYEHELAQLKKQKQPDMSEMRYLEQKIAEFREHAHRLMSMSTHLPEVKVVR